MAKPFVTRLETAGGIAFGAAIAVSPLVIRLRGIPIAVSPCDILMALSALLCTPSLLHRAAGRVPLEAVTPALPLIAVSALSAVATGNLGGGLPDIIQLCLYGGLAAIGSAVVSKTTAAALATAVLGLLLYRLNVEPAPRLFSVAAPLALLPALFASLYMALTPLAPGFMRIVLRVVLLGALLGFSVWVSTARIDKPPQAVPQLRSPIQQLWLEAYAAVTVLGQRPLLGLGPGNYQSHIGEYYKAMPKDNTLAPGTQVGYAVVIASTGLLGLSALIFWLLRIADWVRGASPAAGWLMVPLALCLFLCSLRPHLSARCWRRLHWFKDWLGTGGPYEPNTPDFVHFTPSLEEQTQILSRKDPQPVYTSGALSPDNRVVRFWLGSLRSVYVETWRDLLRQETSAARLFEKKRLINSRFIAEAAQMLATTIIVDSSKSPMQLQFFAASRDLDLKVIHLVRHPGCAMSAAKHNGHTLEYAARLWKRNYNTCLRQIARFAATDTIRVRYEDLSNEPTKVLSSLCVFLGRDYIDKMLQLSI